MRVNTIPAFESALRMIPFVASRRQEQYTFKYPPEVSGPPIDFCAPGIQRGIAELRSGILLLLERPKMPSTDLSALYTQALAINPKFQTKVPLQSLATADENQSRQFIQEIAWQILLAAGTLIKFQGDDVLAITIDPSSWENQSYLGETYWVAKGRHMKQDPSNLCVGGICLDSFIIIIEDFASMIGNTLLGFLCSGQPSNALTKKLLSMLLKNLDVYETCFRKMVLYHEKRHAEDKIFIKKVEPKSLTEADDVSRLNLILKPNSPLRNEPKLARAFLERAADTGGLINQLSEHLNQQEYEIAYFTFLLFIFSEYEDIVNYLRFKESIDEFSNSTQLALIEGFFAAVSTLEDLMRLLHSPSRPGATPEETWEIFFSDLIAHLEQKDNMRDKALCAFELCQELYGLHFLSDAERAQQITLHTLGSEPTPLRTQNY